MIDYYLRKYVFFNLFHEAQDREVAILPAFRLGQIRSLNEFESLLKLVNWQKRKLNLYISCAKLKNIPNFTYNIKERSKFTHEYFTNEFDSNCYERDLFFDWDAENVMDAHKEVTEFKEFLDEFQVPYQIIFSGSRGFHVVIDGKYIRNFLVDNGVAEPHKTIVENIKEAFDFKYLDLAQNGLVNKLRKLGYSLVLPKDKKEVAETVSEQLMNVALPLNDEEFKNFKLKDMLLVNVLKSKTLMRRGNLERFSNLSIDKRTENVKNFIKEVA